MVLTLRFGVTMALNSAINVIYESQVVHDASLIQCHAVVLF